MMRISVVLLALLVPMIAVAQDSEQSSAGKAPTYSAYVAAGYGFSLNLPDSGIIHSPDDADWNKDQAVAFEWTSASDDPVILIQGRVIDFEDELDAETFSIVCETYLEPWNDPEKYTIVTPKDPTNNKPLTIRGRKWSLIEIIDTSNGVDKTVHYSIFSSYSGDKIYTIVMFYLEPIGDRVQAFGFPVIDSFKVTS